MKSKTKKYFEVPEVQKIGIYAIRNKTNDKYYVGSSVNIYLRMLTHARNIIRFNGINAKMAEDIKTKRDFKNFEFIVLEIFENNEITDIELRNKEEKYIQKYNSRKSGYNSQSTYTNGKFGKNQKLCCKIVEIPKEEQTKKLYDRISVTLPKGTKERIQATGESVNGYITRLVLEDLERQEAKTDPQNADSLPDFMRD